MDQAAISLAFCIADTWIGPSTGIGHKGANMIEPTSDASQTSSTPGQWEQIALHQESPVPTSEPALAPVDNASHAAQEALITVDQARDNRMQREVLVDRHG